VKSSIAQDKVEVMQLLNGSSSQGGEEESKSTSAQEKQDRVTVTKRLSGMYSLVDLVRGGGGKHLNRRESIQAGLNLLQATEDHLSLSSIEEDQSGENCENENMSSDKNEDNSNESVILSEDSTNDDKRSVSKYDVWSDIDGLQDLELEESCGEIERIDDDHEIVNTEMEECQSINEHEADESDLVMVSGSNNMQDSTDVAEDAYYMVSEARKDDEVDVTRVQIERDVEQGLSIHDDDDDDDDNEGEEGHSMLQRQSASLNLRNKKKLTLEIIHENDDSESNGCYESDIEDQQTF
jgi:hypothetical protein